jgi:hypothetical protein
MNPRMRKQWELRGNCIMRSFVILIPADIIGVTKSRRDRVKVQKARTKEMRNAYICVEKVKGEYTWDLGQQRRIILKQVLKQMDGRIWTGLF